MVMFCVTCCNDLIVLTFNFDQIVNYGKLYNKKFTIAGNKNSLQPCVFI